MGEMADGLDGVDLVEVALAADPAQAGMIEGLLRGAGIGCLLQPTGVDGPTLGIGLLPPGSQRVIVRASQADVARALLAEALAEATQESMTDIANERHLDDAVDRKPRDYGLIGAYARIWFWSLSAVGIAFGVFLLLRLV
jgi:Putative prokaryotic signal transducing protein